MSKVLTISVAAYNVEKVLEKCLSSLVLPDEYMSKLEVIVVNDGSKDTTSDIAHRYADKYPETYIVVDKENGGYGSTVNTSMQLATGKYFRLLDGDDWYVTENIPKLIDYLEKCEDDIVLSPYSEVYMPDEKQIIVNTDIDNVAMHAMTVRTRLLIDNRVTIAEHCFYTDTEFVIYSLLPAKSISTCDMPIYCYRLGMEEQSVSLAGKKKHFEDAMKVSLCVSKVIEDNQDKLTKAIINRANRVIGLAYTSIAVQDDKNMGKTTMKSFDKKLKTECPYMYGQSNVIKKVKLLRSTRFMTFGYVKNRLL